MSNPPWPTACTKHEEAQTLALLSAVVGSGTAILAALTSIHKADSVTIDWLSALFFCLGVEALRSVAEAGLSQEPEGVLSSGK